MKGGKKYGLWTGAALALVLLVAVTVGLLQTQSEVTKLSSQVAALAHKVDALTPPAR